MWSRRKGFFFLLLIIGHGHCTKSMSNLTNQANVIFWCGHRAMLQLSESRLIKTFECNTCRGQIHYPKFSSPNFGMPLNISHLQHHTNSLARKEAEKRKEEVKHRKVMLLLLRVWGAWKTRLHVTTRTVQIGSLTLVTLDLVMTQLPVTLGSVNLVKC